MTLQVLGSADSLGGDVGPGEAAANTALSLGPDECWICVHTAPHKEFAAAMNLDKQGYRSFVPKITKTVRHARQTKVTSVAFFSCYLFVVLEPAMQAWRPITGTFGVRSLILENQRPKPVPSGVVESLIELTNDAGSLDFRDALSPGQQVRLLSGPFADLVGTLARVDSRDRVAVLLSIMGGERLISVDRGALRPAADL